MMMTCLFLSFFFGGGGFLETDANLPKPLPQVGQLFRQDFNTKTLINEKGYLSRNESKGKDLTYGFGRLQKMKCRDGCYCNEGRQEFLV